MYHGRSESAPANKRVNADCQRQLLQLANGELDFVISDEDMELLENTEHIKDCGESSFLPVFGGKF